MANLDNVERDIYILSAVFGAISLLLIIGVIYLLFEVIKMKNKQKTGAFSSEYPPTSQIPQRNYEYQSPNPVASQYQPPQQRQVDQDSEYSIPRIFSAKTPKSPVTSQNPLNPFSANNSMNDHSEFNKPPPGLRPYSLKRDESPFRFPARNNDFDHLTNPTNQTRTANLFQNNMHTAGY